MAVVVISNLAPVGNKEVKFFCDLIDEFQSMGHTCLLWSCIYKPEFAGFYLPMDWRIKEWPSYYKTRNIDMKTAYSLIDQSKWQIRVDQLCKQDYDTPSRMELLDIIVRTSFDILDTFKPDLFLSWNTLCPHAGIAHDMCKKMGIPSILIERAIYPDTWFIEEGGLLGHSILTGKVFSEIISEEEQEFYRNIGQVTLEGISFTNFNKYDQIQHNETFELLQKEPLLSRRPRIVMFPPDDLTLGFKPAEGMDRIASLPGYESSFDAAKELSMSHDGITVFKPHPSFLEQTFDTTGYPNLFVIDYDFRKLINWADIVASTGSGLEFIAMANNKPVLLLANDLMKGKGIAYEAQEPGNLHEAIKDAFEKKDFESRKECFLEYTGYLMTRYLVSCENENSSYRQPRHVVKELCTQYLVNAKNSPGYEALNGKRAELLENSIVEKLNRDYKTRNEGRTMKNATSEITDLMDNYIKDNKITDPDVLLYLEVHKRRFITSFEWVYPLISRDRNMTILETGAPGFFTHIIRHYFPTIHIDNITSDLRYPFQLESEQYDLILNMEVIEHIKDQNEARLAVVDFSGVTSYLSESYRVLKKEGIMLLSTPNVNSYRNIVRRVDNRGDCLFVIARKNGETSQQLQLEETGLQKTEEQNTKEQFLNVLEEYKNSCAVLDFDYTLFLKNSTDTYLEEIRPKWYGYFLVKLSDRIVMLLAQMKMLDYSKWRDFSRVLTALFLAPWNYLYWLLTAKKRINDNLNKELLDAVIASHPERIVIISFGYKHLIRPLVSALPFKADLICSKVVPGFFNLRTIGKERAIRSLLSEVEINNSIFTTDSKEDRELLDLFHRSFLIPWTQVRPLRFHNAYFPFRYTEECKYPGKNILWNQQFGEDLMVLLLAYYLTGFMFPAIIFFFVSFFCIYEMGYYENDFKASDKNAELLKSAQYREFSSYPINLFGWIWAIILGFAGSLLVVSFENPFVPFAKWIGILVLVRLTFWIFNKLSVPFRLYIFPFLQILKTYSYAAVFTITYPGSLLLFSQVMRQVTNYHIYRSGGEVVPFRRQAHRMMIFLLVAIVLSITIGFGKYILDWRFAIISGWVIYRVFRERHGPGLRALAGLVKDAREFSFFALSNFKKLFKGLL
jgi:SAM-dependent methyltransferase